MATFAKASFVGFGVMLSLEVGFIIVLAILGQEHHWAGTHLSVGPLEFVSLRQTARGFETSAGSGIVVTAAIAGVLNGIGALHLNHSS